MEILVVEDDEAIRGCLTVLLEIEGYQVRSAENARDALDLLMNFKPDLIITDLNMPVMDGYEFLEIKSRMDAIADVPVIVLSGSVETMVDEIPKERFYQFVRKPFDLDEMIDLVKKVISSE